MGLTEPLLLSVFSVSLSQMKTKSRIVSLHQRVRRQRRTTGGRVQVHILAYVIPLCEWSLDSCSLVENNKLINAEKTAKCKKFGKRIITMERLI